MSSPASARAAGFGQPVRIASGVEADGIQVAIAPNGRTAVLFVREVREGRRTRYEHRAAIGPSPDQLGPATTVSAGRRTAAFYEARPQLFARPDGSFVACFPDRSQHAESIDGCSIAPPTGGFGPLTVVRRISRTEHGNMTAAMRTDGTTVLLLTRSTKTPGKKTRRFVSVTTLDAAGTVGPPRETELSSRDSEIVGSSEAPIAVGPDGTVAIPASVPLKGKFVTEAPGVRLLLPGAAHFGPTVQVGAEPVASQIELSWKAGLVVQYVFESTDSDGYQQRFIRRAADGTFGPPLAFPEAEVNDYRSTVDGTLAALPTGDLLAISGRVSSDPEDSDCFNPIAGSVGSGMLTPVGQPVSSVPLSAPGQIALHPRAAVLDDGTVIASWENAADFYGRTRLAASVRAPGATTFGGARALPYLTQAGGQTLAAGGNHAAIAWATGKVFGPANLMVSTLRTEGPYTKFTGLPKHPITPCDE